MTCVNASCTTPSLNLEEGRHPDGLRRIDVNVPWIGGALKGRLTCQAPEVEQACSLVGPSRGRQKTLTEGMDADLAVWCDGIGGLITDHTRPMSLVGFRCNESWMDGSTPRSTDRNVLKARSPSDKPETMDALEAAMRHDDVHHAQLPRKEHNTHTLVRGVSRPIAPPPPRRPTARSRESQDKHILRLRSASSVNNHPRRENLGEFRVDFRVWARRRRSAPPRGGSGTTKVAEKTDEESRTAPLEGPRPSLVAFRRTDSSSGARQQRTPLVTGAVPAYSEAAHANLPARPLLRPSSTHRAPSLTQRRESQRLSSSIPTAIALSVDETTSSPCPSPEPSHLGGLCQRAPDIGAMHRGTVAAALHVLSLPLPCRSSYPTPIARCLGFQPVAVRKVAVRPNLNSVETVGTTSVVGDNNDARKLTTQSPHNSSSSSVADPPLEETSTPAETVVLANMSTRTMPGEVQCTSGPRFHIDTEHANSSLVDHCDEAPSSELRPLLNAAAVCSPTKDDDVVGRQMASAALVQQDATEHRPDAKTNAAILQLLKAATTARLHSRQDTPPAIGAPPAADVEVTRRTSEHAPQQEASEISSCRRLSCVASTHPSCNRRVVSVSPCIIARRRVVESTTAAGRRHTSEPQRQHTESISVEEEAQQAPPPHIMIQQRKPPSSTLADGGRPSRHEIGRRDVQATQSSLHSSVGITTGCSAQHSWASSAHNSAPSRRSLLGNPCMQQRRSASPAVVVNESLCSAGSDDVQWGAAIVRCPKAHADAEIGGSRLLSGETTSRSVSPAIVRPPPHHRHQDDGGEGRHAPPSMDALLHEARTRLPSVGQHPQPSKWKSAEYTQHDSHHHHHRAQDDAEGMCIHHSLWPRKEVPRPILSAGLPGRNTEGGGGSAPPLDGGSCTQRHGGEPSIADPQWTTAAGNWAASPPHHLEVSPETPVRSSWGGRVGAGGHNRSDEQRIQRAGGGDGLTAPPPSQRVSETHDTPHRRRFSSPERTCRTDLVDPASLSTPKCVSPHAAGRVGGVTPYVELLKKASRELHDLRAQRDQLVHLVDKLAQQQKLL